MCRRSNHFADDEDCGYAFIPHVFQQVTFGLMFKVQSGHLLRVSVLQLLRHFDLEGKEEDRTSVGSVICARLPGKHNATYQLGF